MAVSMAKFGKLDAICAKLQQTQVPMRPCLAGDWPVSFQSLRKDNGALEDSENNNNVPLNMAKRLSPSSPWQPESTLSEEMTPLSQGRKKSRKAAIPRNLTQVQNYLDKFDDEKDELTDYKINNQDTNFPPLSSNNDESEEQGCSDKDSDEDYYLGDSTKTKVASNGNHDDSSRASIEDNGESNNPNNCDENDEIRETFSVSDEGALDLSVYKAPVDKDERQSSQSLITAHHSRSRRKGHPVSSFQNNSDERPLNLNITSDTCPADEKLDEEPSASSKCKDGDVDVAVLKNYAERTMNEFLSMYGLHGETAESLTGQVSLQNFSTRKILDQNGQGIAVMSPSSSLTNPSLPFALTAGKMAATAAVQKPGVEGAVYARNITAETIFTLAQLPQGALIGNPQVLLPTNIQSALKLVQPNSLLIANDTVAIKPSNSANYLSPASAAAAVSAVVSPVPGINSHTSLSPNDSSGSIVTSPSKIVLPDYSKYIKRYNSAQECGGHHCQDLAYREHFHCLDCNFRVFVRKEEMIRHFKWHKKRDDSLQHGFMRYSPMDDCSKQFGVCTHNSRQTHYHCLQHGCDKVYISTSDVQMHANYHRKDSAIIQEGFQRFRATEDCGSPSCAFYGQRTTHFHCRRRSCRFTFKNKADMEKHKSYHQKDEILGRDGFKKFMKYEHCPFPTCRFSKVSNHIHCIRPGCDYVLHSTGQLYSHKRKHERRDFECAYRRFKDGQKGKVPIPSNQGNHGSINRAPPQRLVPALGGMGTMTGVMPARIPVIVTTIPVTSASAIGALPAVATPMKKESEYVDLDDLTECKFNPSEENSNNSSCASPPSSLATSNQSDGKLAVAVKTEPEDPVEDDEETEEMDGCETDDAPKGLAAYTNEVTDDQLSDSLTLPIPKYTDTKPNQAQLSQSPTKPNTASHYQSPPKPPCIPTSAEAQQRSVIKASPTVAPPMDPIPSTPERDWPTKLSLSMEKKPKDESWKAYLVRYTANDPCNSRCQYLYKDHYHCKVENCAVLFKSKDAVREHARYHELQDRITSMAYNTCEKYQACPQGCEHSLQEKHYHCIWAGCTHIVLETDAIFSRLEHYRIHDYARAAAGKGRSSNCTSKQESPDFAKRRRGRPPKYPRTEIPVVPKVELTEEELIELNQSQNDSSIQGRLVSSFKKFAEDEACPDELCIYYMREHFHCARPRCHHATDREDVLNLHTKDFHSFVNILEGFQFFDRNINCRRPQCHNNKANRHFHCVRLKCDYSFVRHTTMAQHDKKHKPEYVEDNAEKTPRRLVKREFPNFVPIAPALGWRPKTVVKAAGTFYPISTINSRPPPVQAAGMGPMLGHPVSLHMPIVTTTSSMVMAEGNVILASQPIAATSLSSAVPLTVLLQNKPENTIPQPNWSALRAKMHFAMQDNCGRPFCKLKKKDHYHCLECNQAFSDPARLRSHIGKHGVKLERADSGIRIHRPVAIAPKPLDSPDLSGSEPENLSMDADNRQRDESMSDQEEPEDLSGSKWQVTPSSSLNLNPSMFHNLLAKSRPNAENTNGLDEDDEKHQAMTYQQSKSSGDESEDQSEKFQQQRMEEYELSRASRRSGRKRSAPKNTDFVDSDAAVDKQRRLMMSPGSSSEEEIPNGYQRFRFCDDCSVDNCAYRKTVTHFHCTRLDCNYSFSNRTRMVQHSLRHERIDGVTGDEFRQYRGNVDCGREACEYANKSSHFHCLTCPYVCTDAAQVLAHRKHHQKLNNISSQGFQKFSGTGDCSILTCTYYYKKQTHYHCTQHDCMYAVLAPSQMAPHRLKHLRERV